MRPVSMALKTIGLAFRDLWQELWTILFVQLFFLFAIVLVIPGPPAILALFYYANQIAHDESVNERDFLKAIRQYWGPAWRWGLVNLSIIGLLTGDYYLVKGLAGNPTTGSFLQGLYIALLAGWLLLQFFTLPFLFEQKEPRVLQALRNGAVFIRRNLIFTFVLALLLVFSLMAGMLLFLLTFVFGGAFLAFASNRAVLQDLTTK
jgi:hypothetical protein